MPFYTNLDLMDYKMMIQAVALKAKQARTRPDFPTDGSNPGYLQATGTMRNRSSFGFNTASQKTRKPFAGDSSVNQITIVDVNNNLRSGTAMN